MTADGQIRIANACTNPDLFWALKGGGGGTFAVVNKMPFRTHDLPILRRRHLQGQGASDDAYRRLLGQFVSFYKSIFSTTTGERRFT